MFQDHVVQLPLAVIQIARPARRQAHSSLLVRLEEADGRCREWHEEADAPPTVSAEKDQRRGQAEARDQGDDPKLETLATFRRTDVLNANKLRVPSGMAGGRSNQEGWRSSRR